MSAAVRSLFDWLLSVVLPEPCLGCNHLSSSPKNFCVDCRERLVRQSDDALDGLLLQAPYLYVGPLVRAIVRLKYEDRPEFAPRLVRTCLPASVPAQFKDVTLVPVPMHPVRLCERGYNQAALLARALGHEWRRPVAYRWLARRRLNQHQVGLGRDERARNARDAFGCVAGGLRGQRVVLVDDVVTTGATLRSCAEALTAAGASVRGAVALARAP